MECSRLALKIENFPHILHAYGKEVAEMAVEYFRRLLKKSLPVGAFVQDGAGGTFSVSLVETPHNNEGALSSARWCADWLDTFYQVAALSPISALGGHLHLAVSGRWAVPVITKRGISAVEGRGGISLGADSLPDDETWNVRYRADMERVSKLLYAIGGRSDATVSDAASILFHWHPVLSAAGVGGRSTLYYQAQPALLKGAGTSEVIEAERTALERLGFAPILDIYLIERVIEELSKDPDVVLGVSVSAASACQHEWDGSVANRLAVDRTLAARLVVEISDRTRMTDIGQAAMFSARIRKLGVKVVLDGFGLGFLTIRELLALAPDAVRVDPFFLRRGIGANPKAGLFIDLVSVAGGLAPRVIVTGIETGEHEFLASRTSADWVQGSYFGSPSALRSWRWSVDALVSNPYPEGSAAVVQGRPENGAHAEQSDARKVSMQDAWKASEIRFPERAEEASPAIRAALSAVGFGLPLWAAGFKALGFF